MTMDEEVKTVWIEALRSDEFEQGRGTLHVRSADESRPDKFCCLGLLCHVLENRPDIRERLEITIRHGDESGRYMQGDYAPAGYSQRYVADTEYGPSSDTSVLPETLARAIGLPAGNPMVDVGSAEEADKYRYKDYLEVGDYDTHVAIAGLNDGSEDLGGTSKNFKEIADYIEQQF